MTTSDPDYDVIFRPYITLKNGQRVWTYQRGLKAFPIRVKRQT